MAVVLPRVQRRPPIARDKYALWPRTASDRVRSPPWHPQTVVTSRPGAHSSISLIEGPHTRELLPRPAVLAGHVTATRRRWRGLTVVDRREDVRIANERGLAEEVFHVKHRRVRTSVTPVRGAIYATPSARGVPLMCRRAWMGVHAGPIGVRAVRVRQLSWTFLPAADAPPRCVGNLGCRPSRTTAAHLDITARALGVSRETSVWSLCPRSPFTGRGAALDERPRSGPCGERCGSFDSIQ